MSTTAGGLTLLGGEPSDRLGITVAADGLLSVSGWADGDTLDALLHDLGRRA